MEFFAGNRKCFYNFCKWIKKPENKDIFARAKATLATKNNERKKLPKKINFITILPDAFKIKDKTITRIKYDGENALRFPAGHGRNYVRTLVEIPQTGSYRIWSRYYHRQGTHATLQMKLLPPELINKTFHWQNSTKGCFFNHRFDEAVFRDKNKIPTRKATPSGYIWEDAPLVEFKKGKYLLELSGCVHAGPYYPRIWSQIVICNDPLFIPRELIAETNKSVDGIILSQGSPSRETAELWQLWQLRPGANTTAEAPELASLWQKWRSEFINFLASPIKKDFEYQLMEHMTCFNDEYNLTGTPRQIADFIKTAQANDESSSIKWYHSFEAEDMKNKLGKIHPWKTSNDTTASGRKVISAHYCDGFSGVSKMVSIPVKQKYKIWVRHKNLKKYYSIFKLGIRKEKAQKDFMQFVFGSTEDKKNYPATGYFWSCREIDLSSGKYDISIFKKRGKSPYTYRKVDKIVITSDLNWKPKKFGATPNIKQVGKKSLAYWIQKNPWEGFDQKTTPLNKNNEIINPKEIRLKLNPGEVSSCLLHLHNNTENPMTFTPSLDGKIKYRVKLRVVAYIKSQNYGWQPMPLLQRSIIKVPAKRNASLWLTIDARNLIAGQKTFSLKFGSNKIKFFVDIAGKDLNKINPPLVGGWSAPFARESAWQMYSDIGLNLIHKCVIPKKEMRKYKIKLLNLIPVNHKKINKGSVGKVLEAMHSYDLNYKDWTWEIFDEPHDKSVDKWTDAAKLIQQINPKIQIWCNPGEIQGSSAQAGLKMMPYIDAYCPYVNHFKHGRKTPGYLKKLHSTGNIKLLYTTPCFHEKAPHAPFDMLKLAEYTLKYNRDGWNFFSLCNYYQHYGHSAWDEEGAPNPAQSVSIYPGAERRTISTRNLEAVREAIQRWKKNFRSSGK